jgi:16S rRNA (adenine1518-N6/adenine1519-N6)-dimethyltransferase
MDRRTRRQLGQHFLRDSRVAQAIVDLAAVTPKDLCVEIGPGDGALTERLAERAGRLLALEVDDVLVARLAPRLARFGHIEVRRADARRVDYATLLPLRPDPAGAMVVVGNLPYSVSKPILLRLVEARSAIARMVLTLQKEVADRVVAGPGPKRYGALSILTQLYCDVRLAFTIPPGAFVPAPQVESAVIRLTPLPAPRVRLENEHFFHRLVKTAFAQRRKTVANGLAGGLGLGAEAVKHALAAAGIDPTRRAETLSIEEFARLASAPELLRGQEGE